MDRQDVDGAEDRAIRTIESKRPSSPPKRWGVWLSIPLALIVVALFVLASRWHDTLRVQRVLIEGSALIPAEKIADLAKVTPRTPMSKLDLAAVRDRIAAHPYVKSVAVNRQYPDALAVEIEERHPVALLSGHRMWYVDADGVLLPYARLTSTLDLPVISGIDGLDRAHTGTVHDDDGLSMAIEILTTAQAIDTVFSHFVSEVRIDHDGEVTLYSADAGVPIYFGRGSAAKKLILLDAFVDSVVKTNGTRSLRYLDLRFDGQVVAKWDRAGSEPTRTSL